MHLKVDYLGSVIFGPRSATGKLREPRGVRAETGQLVDFSRFWAIH